MKKLLLVSVVMAGILSAGAVCAQEAAEGAPTCCPCGGMMGKGARKAEMMEWHQKMVEKIKANDAELDKLVAEMNAASGEKKTDAIAAIVNKMMDQRKAWHSDMESRMKKMMEKMKEKVEKVEKGKKADD